MTRLDLVTGAAMFLLSSLVLIATWPLAYWSDFAPGPAFLPRWIAGGGLLCALLLLASRLRGTVPAPAAVADEGPVHLGRPATTLVALVALGALFPLLGLRVAAAVFVLFMLLVVVRRRPLPSVAATAVTVLIVHLVFVRWLAIDIPSSLFGF